MLITGGDWWSLEDEQRLMRQAMADDRGNGDTGGGSSVGLILNMALGARSAILGHPIE